MTSATKPAARLRDCNNMNLKYGQEGVFQVMKKPIPVKAEFAKTDGICETNEGAVPYKKGDAILTGPAGESWPVERGRFENDYQSVAEEKGLYTKRPIVVLGIQMNEPFTARVYKSNAFLAGKKGDWLLQYGKGDFGIVGAEIFNNTYQILAKRA